MGLFWNLLKIVAVGAAAAAVIATVCITVAEIKKKIRDKYEDAFIGKIKEKINRGDFKKVTIGIYDEEESYLGEETFEGKKFDDEICEMEVGDIIELTA